MDKTFYYELVRLKNSTKLYYGQLLQILNVIITYNTSWKQISLIRLAKAQLQIGNCIPNNPEMYSQMDNVINDR